MSMKFRLIIMNFLQYFIWGAWLISFGSYVGNNLGFDGVQIGSFFATMGIASLFMPGLMGIIADRWMPAEKLLGICHLIGAGLLVTASFQTEYVPLYTCMLLSVMFYMPTLALSNSVAYNALEKEGLDIVKDFPPIRVWGTIGFIAAMWVVDFSGFKYSEMQLLLAAGAALILGIYAFTLPKCDINKNIGTSLVDSLGLRAFTLFKDKKMAIFFIFSMLLGAALQITNGFGDLFLSSFASVPEYAESFGVKHSVVLLSISQISEVAFILTIPFFLKRFGIKNVMLISMLAWVLRFGLFGAGNPGAGLWMLLLSNIVYGMAFDFFNISGSLYVEKNTGSGIRASAQGVFMIMTNGIGAIVGSYAAGYVVNYFTNTQEVAGKMVEVTNWPNAWFTFATYMIVVAILFAIIFKYKHEPEIAPKK
ncbi:nucleoside permease [Bacteroides sp. 51]|uniref:nucleoside permease n=1 Tax=Bacteroides sp. 51 TaxID=2302938 RepID=UPI0013CFFC34|nr:nucleoside permease [Bacteroides sp. 51]NDV84082.1 MFS transporter [Bacteroides sp. 51]